MDTCVEPIGRIETPYLHLKECPRNVEPGGPLCRLVIDHAYLDAMFRLSSGQKILILYWFDNVDRKRVQQNSRKTGELAGVFALRTPNRPNPIGAAVVPIEKIEDDSIYVRGLDCLNGTPLLDIKPARAGE